MAVPTYTLAVDAAHAAVEITLSALTGWDRLSLWRIGADGASVPVRGAAGDLVDASLGGASTRIVEDYEAPLDTPVTYRYTVTTVSPATSSSTTTSAVTVPAPANRSLVWLKDPGQPARNVLLVAKSTGAFKRPVEQGVYPIRGSKYPVVISDVRQSRQTTLQVYTVDADEQTRLDMLLDGGGTLLVQGLNYGSMYATVGETDDAPALEDGSHPLRIWSLPLTEVARPTGGLAGTAGRTWQTVRDTKSTWQVVYGDHSTWLGVLTGQAGA